MTAAWTTAICALASGLFAVGSVWLAIKSSRTNHETRNLIMLAESDRRIVEWTQTHSLVVETAAGKQLDVRLDLLRLSTDHTRQLRGGPPPMHNLPDGVRIEYRAEEIPQPSDNR